MKFVLLLLALVATASAGRCVADNCAASCCTRIRIARLNIDTSLCANTTVSDSPSPGVKLWAALGSNALVVKTVPITNGQTQEFCVGFKSAAKICINVNANIYPDRCGATVGWSVKILGNTIAKGIVGSYEDSRNTSAIPLPFLNFDKKQSLPLKSAWDPARK